jgi:thioredoxin 1
MSFTTKYADSEPTRAAIDATPGPLVVEFGAPWCGYCLGVQPALEELMADFPNVQHIKIYDGKGRPLGRSFRVKLWPTLVFLRDGEVLHRAVRPHEEEILDGLRAITAAT